MDGGVLGKVCIQKVFWGGQCGGAVSHVCKCNTDLLPILSPCLSTNSAHNKGVRRECKHTALTCPICAFPRSNSTPQFAFISISKRNHSHKRSNKNWTKICISLFVCVKREYFWKFCRFVSNDARGSLLCHPLCSVFLALASPAHMPCARRGPSMQINK